VIHCRSYGSAPDSRARWETKMTIGKRQITLLVVGLLTAVVAQASQVTDELYGPPDAIRWDMTAISPIGDLGEIETIVDLRGFVPISGPSSIKSAGWDALHYHKIPTLDGIARIYYGNAGTAAKTKLAKVKLLTEENVAGEPLKWAKFSYALAKTSGTDLFVSAGGDKTDLESAEPIAILFTHRSVFAIINFRYSDFARVGTGQILCAFEFSRKLKEYKTLYRLHSTILFNKSARDAFSISLPIVAKVLAAQF